MANLYYANQYFSTTLNVGGGIDDSQTDSIVLQSVSGITDITKPGICCISYADPIVTSTAEWVTYTSINGSNELQGVTRGAEGFSAKSHSNGATIAFPLSRSHINNINDKLTGVDTTAIQDANGNEILKTATVTSAVNEITISNNSTGVSAIVSATGETNTGIDFKAKGTGVIRAPVTAVIQVLAGTTAWTVADGHFYFTIPEELNGMNLVRVHARAVTAGTTNTSDIQIANVTDSVDMLSTKITLDSTETGSDTAAAPAVIDTTKDDVVTNDLIRVDIDAISTTPPQGFILRLSFALP